MNDCDDSPILNDSDPEVNNFRTLNIPYSYCYNQQEFEQLFATSILPTILKYNINSFLHNLEIFLHTTAVSSDNISVHQLNSQIILLTFINY